jgi:hypothetical protein
VHGRVRGTGFRAYCVPRPAARGNRISEVRDVDLEWSAPREDATGFVVGD